MTTSMTTLGEIADFINGVAFKADEWTDVGTPIIRIQNLNDATKPFNRTTRSAPERNTARNGDLLVSWAASLGVYEWKGEKAYINQHIFKVIPDESKIDRAYLRQVLEASIATMESQMHGATMKHITRGKFLSMQIPLPPISEQRRIAAILEKADALRAKRREAIAKIDQLLQSLFLEMFGDPIANPKGWPGNTTLGDIALDMQYGPRFHNEAYSLNGIKIVRITDLNPTGELDFNAMPRMDVEEDVQLRFVLQPGDIIFARTGATVGKVALIQTSDPPSIAGAYFIRIQVNNSVMPEYVFAALRTKTIQKFIAEKSRQAAQQNFSGPGLRKLPMPVPPLELQCQFASLARKIEQQRRSLKEHLEQVDTLFASLQDRAFNGKL